MAHQVLHRGPLAERAAQAHVGPLHQGGHPGALEAQERPHLGVEVGVGKRVGRELVAQEVADGALGVGDGG